MKLLLLQLLFVSCRAFGGQDDEVNPLHEGIGNLSVNILKNFADDRKNSIHSAYGIASALALCLFGAEGKTHKALQNVLGLNSMTNSSITRAFRDTEKLILETGQVDAEANHTLTLSSANALFTNESIGFKPEYLETVRKVFNDSAFETVNFGTDAAAIQSKINKFVDRKTHGKIQELLDHPLESNTLMAVVNAVYFKGSWRIAFKNKTWDEGFNNFTCEGTRDLTTETPKWMALSSKLRYARSSDLRAHLLELPYQSSLDSSVSMILVLPFDDFKCNFTNWINDKLDWSKLSEAMKEMFETRIELTLPKFNLKSTYDMRNALSLLGLEIAFSNEASFGGMLPKTEVSVPISNFIHKAKMSVDELGTEAAAASGAFLRRRSRPLPSAPPMELVFNRSFLSLIVVSQEGSQLPIFTAIVNEV